ncbi:hypothetical protein [Dapis sp. BLCC M229]|uniref:hypothetical protein n=1 Tax=Dapis sp. BLCC M229 TaxID=3400188 RepID=UPI003CE745A6
MSFDIKQVWGIWRKVEIKNHKLILVVLHSNGEDVYFFGGASRKCGKVWVGGRLKVGGIIVPVFFCASLSFILTFWS